MRTTTVYVLIKIWIPKYVLIETITIGRVGFTKNRKTEVEPKQKKRKTL